MSAPRITALQRPMPMPPGSARIATRRKGECPPECFSAAKTIQRNDKPPQCRGRR
jgi:hypothetical protein